MAQQTINLLRYNYKCQKVLHSDIGYKVANVLIYAYYSKIKPCHGANYNSNRNSDKEANADVIHHRVSATAYSKLQFGIGAVIFDVTNLRLGKRAIRVYTNVFIFPEIAKNMKIIYLI